MIKYNQNVQSICLKITNRYGNIGRNWVKLLFLQKRECMKNNKDRMKNNKKFHIESDTIQLHKRVIAPKKSKNGGKTKYINEDDVR